jgi:hypothetical protein
LLQNSRSKFKLNELAQGDEIGLRRVMGSWVSTIGLLMTVLALRSG